MYKVQRIVIKWILVCPPLSLRNQTLATLLKSHGPCSNPILLHNSTYLLFQCVGVSNLTNQKVGFLRKGPFLWLWDYDSYVLLPSFTTYLFTPKQGIALFCLGLNLMQLFSHDLFFSLTWSVKSTQCGSSFSLGHSTVTSAG